MKMKIGRVRSQRKRLVSGEGRARLGMRSNRGPSPSRGAGMKVAWSVVRAVVFRRRGVVERGLHWVLAVVRRRGQAEGWWEGEEGHFCVEEGTQGACGLHSCEGE